MPQTPDTRHWWQLVFLEPSCGHLAGTFITETDTVEIAVARAELAGARPPGCLVSAVEFHATAVHPDYLDILLTRDDFAVMPMPPGFQRIT